MKLYAPPLRPTLVSQPRLNEHTYQELQHGREPTLNSAQVGNQAHD